VKRLLGWLRCFVGWHGAEYFAAHSGRWHSDPVADYIGCGFYCPRCGKCDHLFLDRPASGGAAPDERKP